MPASEASGVSFQPNTPNDVNNGKPAYFPLQFSQEAG